jgi:hypothetical protein
MNISQIASIALERDDSFHHYIVFHDSVGYELERTKVRANTSWEAYNKVLSAWFSHPQFNGINKEKK